MAWADDYASSAELKAHLRITDTDDDTSVALAIGAASRAIDDWCNRQFGLTGSAVPRYYTADDLCIEGRRALAIDDLMTTTGLEVELDTGADGLYATELAYGTDFDVYPWNAQANGRPWTHLVLRPDAAASWPCAARGVRVTGNFGWSSVPEIVKSACLIQAARFFVRRDSSYGIAGSPELGSEVRLLARLDPDVSLMLSTVRRVWSAV